MNQLWVFDLDGTLMDTMHLYSDAYLDAARLIKEVVGWRTPHMGVLLPFMKDVNEKLVDVINPHTNRPYSYDKRRFPRALQDAYRQLCATVKQTAGLLVLGELRAIGEGVFNPHRYARCIKPAARPLLQLLQEKGDHVVILTKGDPEVQHDKLQALTAAGVPYITGVVVERSKSEQFTLLRAKHCGGGWQSISVGDSYAADIDPALACGYSGIWIDFEGWEQIGKMDAIRTKAKAAQVTMVDDLDDVLQVVATGTT